MRMFPFPPYEAQISVIAEITVYISGCTTEQGVDYRPFHTLTPIKNTLRPQCLSSQTLSALQLSVSELGVSNWVCKSKTCLPVSL